MSTWLVPGRIEVLGKHTDYGGGQVLVGAVERAITVRAQPLAGAGANEFVARTTLASEPVRFTAHAPLDVPAGHWANYVRTAVDRLHANFGDLPPLDITVDSDLPPASGMSSSSALLTGVALVIADHAGLWERPQWASQITDRLELAQYAACIENGSAFGTLEGNPGVGTSGGSLDHTGMLTSQAGKLSHVRFGPPDLRARVPLPHGYTFVVGVSGVLAEKTGAAREAYNRGPATLRAIFAEYVQRHGSQAPSLHALVRDLVGSEGTEPIDPDDPRLEPLRACASDSYARGRLAQFVEESETLVPSAVDALSSEDLARFAAIVERSQHLAQIGLKNQIPETVSLVELAHEHGAVSASAFGAGFGGSVWALIANNKAQDFADRWREAYLARFPDASPTMVVTGAGDAARRIEAA